MTGHGMIRDRHSLLARAGDLLAEPLDVNAQLNALARVVLPELADCYAVYLLPETEHPVLAAVHHVDLMHQSALRVLVEAFPVSLSQPPSNSPGYP